MTPSEINAVAEAVVKSMDEKHICRLKLDELQITQLSHAVGVWSDLGEGNLPKGIEEMRENHRWLIKMRGRSEKTAMAIWICWVTLVVGGAATALWLGIKHLLEIAPKP
jgi:hypothetical protein